VKKKNYIFKFFEIVGRPFYFLLSGIFIALIFTLYIIGHTVTKAVKLITKIEIKKNKKYLILCLLLSLVFVFYYLILKDLPSPKKLTSRNIELSTKIYDRNGILLYTIYKDKNRTPVKLSQVPKHVQLATLAAEDAEFYMHPGFSIRGMLRAITKNLKEGKLEGGSTITQQLVKNALLSSEKTFIRKARELILSVGVELTYEKDQILEMYLNEVNYGGTVYGIEEAARHYFGKNVENLTLSESAMLAGLPKSPTKFSPFGGNPDLAFARQREVLYLMKVNKFITEEEENKAINQRLSFIANKQNILAPHFVMYIKEKLVDMYGEEMVLTGGLSVTTSLDLNIQLLAEEAVKEEIDKLKNLNVGNGAVVILNPKTFEILAMVGSKDYFDIQNGGNVNVTVRPRQPGSSIKVINYAQALSGNYTLATIVDDTPITYIIKGQPPYSPKNYDNTYRGKMTVRQALAQSRNIPAVRILASYGVSEMIDLGQKMGITTWNDRSRFGLSLTLGGGETKLLDLASVYAVIANYGKGKQIKDILEVKNNNGKILYSKNNFEENGEQVIDPRVSYLLIDVLKDNIARSPAFGANSMLVIPNHPEVAVKTGTSNNLKDNLTIGFSQDFVVAVWVGNNNGSPMARIASGITGAAPIWNRIMKSLLFDKESVEWPTPQGLVYKECFSRKEWFLEEKQLSCPKIIEPAATDILIE